MQWNTGKAVRSLPGIYTSAVRVLLFVQLLHSFVILTVDIFNTKKIHDFIFALFIKVFTTHAFAWNKIFRKVTETNHIKFNWYQVTRTYMHEQIPKNVSIIKIRYKTFAYFSDILTPQKCDDYYSRQAKLPAAVRTNFCKVKPSILGTQ